MAAADVRQRIYKRPLSKSHTVMDRVGELEARQENKNYLMHGLYVLPLKFVLNATNVLVLQHFLFVKLFGPRTMTLVAPTNITFLFPPAFGVSKKVPPILEGMPRAIDVQSMTITTRLSVERQGSCQTSNAKEKGIERKVEKEKVMTFISTSHYTLQSHSFLPTTLLDMCSYSFSPSILLCTPNT